MIQTQAALLAYLDEQKIRYELIEHPAVFTCEDAALVRPNLAGVSTKNLFLGDRQGRFYLLMTECSKRVDLKAIGRELGTSKLHFASETMLLELLGLTPGGVTVLGLINDSSQRVKLLIDTQIWGPEDYWCHPLVNTATVVISQADLERFFELSRHDVVLVSKDGD